MIVKYFKKRKGKTTNGLGGLKYLLDKKRVENGTAKVLRGDSDQTRDLILSMRTKQKTTMGCLSFEETFVEEKTKQQLMDEFEELTFPGLDKSQYSILWVEHTDKDGRIELNFLITKIELTTAKPIQPYYYKADFPRVDKWQRLQNLKYDFSDPLDPRKARAVSGSEEVTYLKDYFQLNIALHSMVQNGELNSRDEIISYIEDNGGKITRKNKNGFSIKLPGKKQAKRFNTGKTGIYSENFTSPEALSGIQEAYQKEIDAYIANREQFKVEEMPRLEKSIEEMKEYKAKELLKKFPLPELPTYSDEEIIIEEIAHDRDREEVKRSTGSERQRPEISPDAKRRIEVRARARAAEKRKRSEEVYRELKTAREKSLEWLKGRRERVEENARSFYGRVQSLGAKIRQLFGESVKLKNELMGLSLLNDDSEFDLGSSPGEAPKPPA